jgi:hypothetical protein
MRFQFAPIERRRRRRSSSRPSNSLLVEENLFSSLLAGSGLMASLSTAALLQYALPWFRVSGFPLAGLLGLLFGWMLAYPVARWLTRHLNPARLGIVLFVALVTGLLWATPAAFLASSIGWVAGALPMYVVAILLSASGLVWGGYLDCDRLVDP